MSRLWLPLRWVFVRVFVLFARSRTARGEFLCCATVYPGFQTREERNEMRDEPQPARFKVWRVGESSWGSLKTPRGSTNSPGGRNFST